MPAALQRRAAVTGYTALKSSQLRAVFLEGVWCVYFFDMRELLSLLHVKAALEVLRLVR